MINETHAREKKSYKLFAVMLCDCREVQGVESGAAKLYKVQQ